MYFLFPIRQAMITVDSKQLFICLDAAQRKIANLISRGVAMSKEWTKFVKDETEI